MGDSQPCRDTQNKREIDVERYRHSETDRYVKKREKYREGNGHVRQKEDRRLKEIVWSRIKGTGTRRNPIPSHQEHYFKHKVRFLRLSEANMTQYFIMKISHYNSFIHFNPSSPQPGAFQGLLTPSEEGAGVHVPNNR